MARQNFVIEKGLKIVDAGTNTGVEHIQGSGAPTLDAPVGSLYSDRSTGEHYQKITIGTGADKWTKLAVDADVQDLITLSGRPENSTSILMSGTDDFGTGMDNVLDGVTTINAALSRLNRQSSHLNKKEKFILGSELGWVTLASFNAADGICFKAYVMTGSLDFGTATTSQMVQEILMIGQGSTGSGLCDFTTYGKLKINEVNGAPVDEIFDQELRGVYDAVNDVVSLEIKFSATTTVDKYVSFRIIPLGNTFF